MLTITTFGCILSDMSNKKEENLRQKAIRLAGGGVAVSSRCDVSYEAVRKWGIKGFPRTEWTGETNYAETIIRMIHEKEPGNELTVDDLLLVEAA